MKNFLVTILIVFVAVGNCQASIPENNGQGTMGGSVGTMIESGNGQGTTGGSQAGTLLRNTNGIDNSSVGNL